MSHGHETSRSSQPGSKRGDADPAYTFDAKHVYGLSPSFQRQSVGTYSSTDVLGWQLLNAGDGTVIATPKGNGSAVTYSNAELLLMTEGQHFFDHCSAIEVTGTTEIKINIP